METHSYSEGQEENIAQYFGKDIEEKGKVDNKIETQKDQIITKDKTVSQVARWTTQP